MTSSASARKAITHSLEQGDLEAAAGALEAGLDRFPDDPGLLQLGYRCAMRSADAEQAFSFCSRLMHEDPDNLVWASRMARLYRHLGEINAASDFVRAKLEGGDAGPGIYVMAANLPLPGKLMQHVLAWAQGVDASAPALDRKAASWVLIRLGEDPAHLETDEDSQLRWTERAQRASEAEAPADRDLRRPLVVDAPGSEVLVAEAPDSKTCVLVFTGLADRTGMHITVLDRYLAALNVTAVYLRDFSRLLFNNGIQSIGKDYSSTIRHLSGLLDDLGMHRLVCLGCSAGGYGAIRYGIELGAGEIIGFSSPTNITADFLADDGRGKLVVKRVNKELAKECMDLRPIVRAAQGRSPIHLYYGEQMRQDRRHAEHIAAEPGTTLHALAGIDRHNILGILAETEELLPVLRRHLSEPLMRS